MTAIESIHLTLRDFGICTACSSSSSAWHCGFAAGTAGSFLLNFSFMASVSEGLDTTSVEMHVERTVSMLTALQDSILEKEKQISIYLSENLGFTPRFLKNQHH